MKKIFKSIPFVLLAAQTIPLVVFTTSCGTVEDKYTIVDLAKTEGKYTPTTEPLKDPEGRKWLNQKEVTELYVSTVNNNQAIFVDDVFYSCSLMYDTVIAPIYDDPETGIKYQLTKCEVGVTKPVFGSTRVWEIGFDDTEFSTISFEYIMNLQYETEFKNQKIIKNVNTGITYDSVIFLPFEGSAPVGAIRDPGWYIGFIDQSLDEDAFWMHAYNTKPWSISYHSTITEKKYIHGVNDDDIVIDSSSYYSGSIADAVSLKTTYDFVNRPPENEIGLTNVEKLLGHMVLFDTCFSHVLTNIINEPDVCVNKQLSFAIPISSETNIFISHIHLINCLSSKVVDPGSYSITLGGNSADKKIVLTEITKSKNPRTITIDENVPLVLEDSLHQDYAIRGVLSQPYEPLEPGEIVTFSIPYRQLKFNINYTSDLKPQEPIQTYANLHYNNIVGIAGGNQN